MPTKKLKVVIYGGNGFVGTHIAERLSQENVEIVCVSRRGHKPLHLQGQTWSESVRWCKGDANSPDPSLLAESDFVVISIGSPPLPTFSKESFEQQLNNNGVTPSNAIRGADAAGVKSIILMGAQIPFFANNKHFAYTKGKNMALECAKEFANRSNQHQAFVLQPGAIYGKRYLSNGKPIHLDKLMLPAYKILPSQFTDISRITERVKRIIIDHSKQSSKFTVFNNLKI